MYFHHKQLQFCTISLYLFTWLCHSSSESDGLVWLLEDLIGIFLRIWTGITQFRARLIYSACTYIVHLVNITWLSWILSIIWIFQNLLGHLLEKALCYSFQNSLGDLQLVLQQVSWNMLQSDKSRILQLINKALEESFENSCCHLREGHSSEEVTFLHLLHLHHLPSFSSCSFSGPHESLWDPGEEEEEEK